MRASQTQAQVLGWYLVEVLYAFSMVPGLDLGQAQKLTEHS
jgi:hypothetical protein